MKNGFILLFEEVNDYRLLISLNDEIDFIPLRYTAFAIHPNRPTGGFDGFGDWFLAVEAKHKWEKFLDNYLKK